MYAAGMLSIFVWLGACAYAVAAFHWWAPLPLFFAASALSFLYPRRTLDSAGPGLVLLLSLVGTASFAALLLL